MSGPAEKLEDQSLTVNELDDIFFSIMTELGKNSVEGAAQCTNAIFKLTSNYVDRPAFEVLKKFHDFYFGSQDIESRKNDVDQGVSDLFEQIQSRVLRGEDLSGVTENEAVKKRRLGLAGVQKQLEGLITLNAGIKTQIIPTLSSMQFEDAINQRIAHLVEGWKKINEFLHNTALLDAGPLARELAKVCTSVEETSDFYEIVLEEELPPEEKVERSIFLEF